METVFFTQLSVQEIKMILREEIRTALKELKTTNNTSEYLSIKELSKLLNIVVPSIYGLCHRKQIPYIKRGKKLLFEKNQIDEWLRNGRQKTKQEINEEIENIIGKRKK